MRSLGIEEPAVRSASPELLGADAVWWQATLISFAVLALTWLALLALLVLFRPGAGTLRQMPRALS